MTFRTAAVLAALGSGALAGFPVGQDLHRGIGGSRIVPVGTDRVGLGTTVSIGASVAGDVRVAADRVMLGPGARIEGDLRYRSPDSLRRAPGAVVGGDVVREPPGEPAAPGWVGELVRLAAFLLIGVALAAVFPGGAAA